MPRLKKELVEKREAMMREYLAAHPGIRQKDAQAWIQGKTGMKMNPRRLNELMEEAAGGTVYAGQPIEEMVKPKSDPTDFTVVDGTATTYFELHRIIPKDYEPVEPLVGDKERKEAFDDLMKVLEEQAEYYNAEGVSDRYRMYAQQVFDCQDTHSVQTVTKKVQDGQNMHFLYQWATGKVPGPHSVSGYLKQASKAESLARFLDSKGQTENAEKQRERAAKLRQQAEELRKQQGTPVDLGEDE